MDKKSIINKPFVSTSDICELLDIGRNKAIEIKKSIADELEAQGYIMPRKSVIPTKKLIERCMIDVTKL